MWNSLPVQLRNTDTTKRLVTRLNYNLRYINNFIYLSIYLPTDCSVDS